MKKWLANLLILAVALCAWPALAESYDDALDAAFEAGLLTSPRGLWQPEGLA